MSAIRLRDARIGYGDVAVVQGVDLTVADGEAVAVLGSNGSGKTTLSRGLLGLATVLGGEVEVLGAPVGRPRERGRIGYVPQRHTVSGAVPATVREVVGVGRLARLGLFCRLRPADRAAVADAVAAVGLADRYGLEVVGISGLSPSQEPDPAQLAEITALVRERGVTTVYTETLVDPAVAETVATEAGVRTAVLDPIEGLTDESAGSDYLEVMRANLATLREGQSCP